MENIEEQIKNVIHKLRPYLQRDGGDIEYKGSPSILNKQGRKDSISRK